MEPSPQAWVAQRDGTYLPSAELLRRVRENPSAFPNVVKDISALSGMPTWKVEEALWNPWRHSERFPTDAIGSTVRYSGEFGAGAVRGLGEGIATAMDKLHIGGSQWLRDRTNLNPGFDTEHSLHENIGEIVGEVAPGVATSIGAFPATAALGGGTLAATGASILGGSLVTTLTEKPEDSLFNVIDEMTR